MRTFDIVLDRVARAAGLAFTLVAVLVLVSPILFTVLLSFSNDPSIRFPVSTWGFGRYIELFTSQSWLDSLWLSTRLALVSAAIATAVSVPALYAIMRSKFVLRNLVEQVSIVSLLFPITAYAVAMYGVFAQLKMLGQFWGLAVAHAMLAIPFVMLIGAIGLRAQAKELELVAITLGANRFRAFSGITLRLAIPSLIGGFVLAFQASFEEAVLVNFLGGPGLLTLPKRILDSLQWGSEPVVSAIASLVSLITSVFVVIFLTINKGPSKK